MVQMDNAGCIQVPEMWERGGRSPKNEAHRKASQGWRNTMIKFTLNLDGIQAEDKVWYGD